MVFREEVAERQRRSTGNVGSMDIGGFKVRAGWKTMLSQGLWWLEEKRGWNAKRNRGQRWLSEQRWLEGNCGQRSRVIGRQSLEVAGRRSARGWQKWMEGNGERKANVTGRQMRLEGNG
jgi:hypothetical protein